MATVRPMGKFIIIAVIVGVTLWGISEYLDHRAKNKLPEGSGVGFQVPARPEPTFSSMQSEVPAPQPATVPDNAGLDKLLQSGAKR